jgi:hypothetical protein
MSFLVAAAFLVVSGIALLRLARLATGRLAVDVPLGWLAGSGWFAAAAALARFALGVPLSRAVAIVLVLLPIAGWAGVRGRVRGRDQGEPASPRWLPRPLWLFVPLAAYVAVVLTAVLLHGVNTPTHTDDAMRVRAFAPMLAFDDAWGEAARGIFVAAGALPTFVPALAWIATGAVDHFHVNYWVLAELCALLSLAVGLGAARGSPERGWGSAFALLSLPLLVYHCTSTYSDAVLALRVGGGVLLWIEYARTGDRRDAARALLLLGLASLVKREGELVAAAPAAVLVLQLAVERARGRPLPWGALSALAVPVALGAVAKIGAVGLAAAFPMVRFVAEQSGLAGAPGPERPAGYGAAAAAFFLESALLRSGNAGGLYLLLPAAALVRARAVVRSGLAWPAAGVAALLAEVAVSSILLVPQYTLDQSTVHRALLVVSVPGALWLAAVLADAAHEKATAAEPAAAAPGARKRKKS